MQKQKILFTNYQHGIGGGHTPYILNLCKIIQGFEFVLACPKESFVAQKAEEMGVRTLGAQYIFKYGSPLVTWRCIKRLHLICEMLEPAIVHTNAAQDMNIALIVRKLFKHKFKIVRTQHAIRRVSDSFYHRAFYNQVDKYIYMSHASMETCTNGVLRPKNWCVIEGGIDTNYFAPREKDKALAKSLGIQKSDFVFGTCAGLKDYKRVDLMIKAAGELVKKGKRFKVLLLGEQEHWFFHKPLVDKLGLQDVVIYAGNQNDVRPYVSLFDFGFLLSDATETLSYASREMISMSVPLISSDFSGLPDNVDHEVNGFVVPSGQLGPLIDTMIKILSSSKEVLGRLRWASRQKALRFFSIENQIQSYQNLYDSLLI